LKQRSGQVESQIARYVTQLDEGRAASFQAESALIRDVRRVIYRKPTIGNLYAEIKQKGSNSLRPLRLSTIVQQSGGATLFSTTPEVSGFFTKQGWNGYVQERIEKVAQNPGEGDWVLGNQSSQLSDELKQEDKIIEQLRERYFRDYATAWTDFLRRVQYRSFDRVGGTARALNTLGDPLNSPVLHLLARVTTETRFASSMAKKAKGQVKEEVKTRAQAKIRQRTRSSGTLTQPSGEEETTIHPVTREFTGLHQLKADKAASGEASSELTRTLRALGRVGRTLDDLAGSPGKATEVAVRVLNGESELQSALTTIRNGLPRLDAQVRRQLFEEPLLNAWSTILWTAQEQLNRQWRRDVYRPYQKNLKGRYPFDPSSEDASLADVERFFGPQKGIVASFKQKELRPFLREGRLEPKTWEGRGLRLSPSTRAFLDAVDRIGQTLMGSGALRLRFKLIPEIPKKEGDAPAPSQVFIRAHGTSQTYEMGYQPKTMFTWPGARGARLVLDTRGATFTPKRKEGAWAWFRLLEEASVEPRSPDVYRVRWRFAKENRYAIITRYNLQSGKHQRLFTNPAGFFRLSVPEQL
jgi:type VI secretion system protein ImpL